MASSVVSSSVPLPGNHRRSQIGVGSTCFRSRRDLRLRGQAEGRNPKNTKCNGPPSRILKTLRGAPFRRAINCHRSGDSREQQRFSIRRSHSRPSQTQVPVDCDPTASPSLSHALNEITCRGHVFCDPLPSIGTTAFSTWRIQRKRLVNSRRNH